MEECFFCDTLGSSEPPEGGWVYESDRFRAFAIPTNPVAGWLCLLTVRHAEGLDGLDDEESRELGVAIQRISSAMVDVTGRPATYMFAMPERVRHFHLAMGSAPETAPDEPRGGPLLAKVLLKDPSLSDRPEALRLAAQLREVLARTAG